MLGEALHILEKIAGAADEIKPELLGGRLDDLRICERRIRRRQKIEDLAGGEGDDIAVLSGNARHSGGRGAPPFLAEDGGLRTRIKGG